VTKTFWLFNICQGHWNWCDCHCYAILLSSLLK